MRLVDLKFFIKMSEHSLADENQQLRDDADKAYEKVDELLQHVKK